MAYRVTEDKIVPQAIADVSTTQKLALGTTIRAYDEVYGEGTFIYVKGVASGLTGSWAIYNADDWSTTLLVANGIGPVGVMMAALVASTFGWIQVDGKAIGKCLTSFADNARVFGTGTAGSVDDTSVAGDFIFPAKGASTTVVSSGVAEFEIHRPWTDDKTGADT
jgi:hypothetical protein